jgi:HTH-type transcriptional regulator/antitoxin HigA
MKYYIIQNNKQYEKYLCDIGSLMNKGKLNKEEMKVLDLLSKLVEWYEEEKGWALDEPDPLKLIKIRMNDLGLIEKDLVGLIGSKGHVSKILNGKRSLTVEHILILANLLKVNPTDLMPKRREYQNAG